MLLIEQSMRTCGSTISRLVLGANTTSASVLARSPCFRHHLPGLHARAYARAMSPHSLQPDGVIANGQHQPQYNITELTSPQGDLNNTSSMRQTDEIHANLDYAYRSLAIPTEEEEPEIRTKYRPFLLDDAVAAEDWVAKLELATVTEMAQRDFATTGERLKVLVLYGSLRER